MPQIRSSSMKRRPSLSLKMTFVFLSASYIPRDRSFVLIPSSLHRNYRVADLTHRVLGLAITTKKSALSRVPSPLCPVILERSQFILLLMMRQPFFHPPTSILYLTRKDSPASFCAVCKITDGGHALKDAAQYGKIAYHPTDHERDPLAHTPQAVV